MKSMSNYSSMNILIWVLTCLSHKAVAYTLQMAYQPPVKSSVNVISSRISFRPSNNAVSHHAVSVGTSAEARSLRSRVKHLVIGGLKDRIKPRPAVEVVEDISDFKTKIRGESHKFVAVMFHAPFCKACQAASPHFHKMARQYSDVKFLSVPLTDANKNMLHGLGIVKFPFAHIYDPEKGLVDELPMLRKLIPRFEERLLSYVNEKK